MNAGMMGVQLLHAVAACGGGFQTLCAPGMSTKVAGDGRCRNSVARATPRCCWLQHVSCCSTGAGSAVGQRCSFKLSHIGEGGDRLGHLKRGGLLEQSRR